jgi:homotetrameric cytidine deaminase
MGRNRAVFFKSYRGGDREMMWQRLTERARQVIFYAQEEAQTLQHSQVNTEHLLLGLLRIEDADACLLLRDMGVDLQQLQQAVLNAAAKGNSKPGQEMQLTPRGKRVIDLAYDEARQLNHQSIGTEHFLLALIREGEGIASKVLGRFKVDLDTTRKAVMKMQDQSNKNPPAQESSKPLQQDTGKEKLAPDVLHSLITQSLIAHAFAYAPYSRYEVGAAVLVDDGQIFSGCNVENASYGLSICAERVAIFNAIAAGMRNLKAIAVATKDGGTPCGACRQVISEFADNPEQCLILLVKSEQEWESCTLAELLPRPFDF